MSWNWYEYRINSDGNTQYNRCKVCNKFPALILAYQDDNEYGGMFCEEHWIQHIKHQFGKLNKKLKNENPDIDPQHSIIGKCEFCKKDIYKIYFLKWCGMEFKVCYNCYDKYSVR